MKTRTDVPYSACLLACYAALAAMPKLADAADLFVLDFENYSTGRLLDVQPPQPEPYGWRIDQGTAVIQTNVVRGGKQSLRVDGKRSAVTRRFDGGNGITPLSSLTPCYDGWIYPDCDPAAYIVALRVQALGGKCFMDVHLDANGGIRVMTSSTEKDAPERYVDSGAAWQPKKWLRLTVKMNLKEQKFQLYVNGERTANGPWPFAHPFQGAVGYFTLEGPNADSGSCYYDDLRWSDADPLVAK